ncbi:MAG: hypothetical protein K2X48_01230 [Chitinophagaceae bacterium]|nr:hypothetical protein [Chitinophagaceae bacterium]
MKPILLSLFIVSFIACNSNQTSTTEPYAKERATVKTDAVATYTETESNGDSSKTFKVQLFEQKESLSYEVKFSYNGASSEKIFSYPNMHMMPKPGLKKGPAPMSCIVGFYDADSVFMDLRLIAVEKGTLVYRHLKEYSVPAAK